MTKIVGELRSLAVSSLARMYRPEDRVFGFCLRKVDSEIRLEGKSRRYTATVLIGLVTESPEAVAEALHGQTIEDVCGHLIDGVEQDDDIGSVALTHWAARAVRHAGADRVLRRLRSMNPATAACPTVELAWSLTSLVFGEGAPAGTELAETVAQRLMGSFNPGSGLFKHWPRHLSRGGIRSHICCFADLVYPIQALSYHHKLTGDEQAMRIARRCAERMCTVQGPAGQWWWHYDTRTGRMVERFPVYSVHQDSMGPMALFALESACGDRHHNAVIKSLAWLVEPPEIDGSLLDREAGIIWRKVARHEPGKLVRGLQATASRLHKSLRVPAVDLLFRPGFIDYESRPYHMGWILHAFPAGRAESLQAVGDGV